MCFASPQEFWALSASTGMIVTAAVDTAGCSVGIALGGAMLVGQITGETLPRINHLDNIRGPKTSWSNNYNNFV
jgi:hypothetical protein